jgi:hypothetical protein
VIVLFVACIEVSHVRLGVVAFVAIAAGGLVMGMSGSIAMYVAGFLMVIGFDKMFNVYIRSARQAIIPRRDYGTTTGGNATQPLAGLLVGLFSGHGRVALVVTLPRSAWRYWEARSSPLGLSEPDRLHAFRTDARRPAFSSQLVGSPVEAFLPEAPVG